MEDISDVAREVRISRLLARLSSEGLASRVRVFGSVMKGDPSAGDVDCVLDLDDPPFLGIVSAPALILARPGSFPAAMDQCLEIRRDPFFQGVDGPLLNCFARSGGVLYSPTRSSTWWEVSSVGESIWQKAIDRGASLSSIVWPPAKSPGLSR